MQLIMETENPSININEKMSALDDDTLDEKALPNGDVKDVEEVNGRLETNGTSDKENVQNNENILNKSDDIGNQKEAGDVVSAEKPIEEFITIEKNTLLEGKEHNETTLKKLDSQDEKQLEFDDTEINIDEQQKPELEDKEEQLLDKEQNLKLCDAEMQHLHESKADLDGKATQLNDNEKPKSDMNEKQEMEELDGAEKIKFDGPEILTTDLQVEPSLTEVITAKISETMNESQNVNAQEKEDSVKNVDLEKSASKIVESMEIDGISSNTVEEDIEDFSEKDITQSINDMVENIVQNLKEDNSRDSQDNIEVDIIEKDEEKLNTEKDITQDIEKNNTVKELIDKTEKENPGIVQINESKLQETTVEPEISSNIEEHGDKMEVDQEPDSNANTETSLQHQDSLDNAQSKEAIALETLSNSNSFSPATKDTVNPEKSLETDCNNENNNAAQDNINNDIELETSVKESHVVHSNVDNVVQVDTAETIVKESDRENNETTSMEIDTNEIIDLKSGDSSVNNLEDAESSSTEIKEDITVTSSDIEKPSNNANKDNSESPNKQELLSNNAVSEAKDDTADVDEIKMIEETKTVSEQKKQNEKTPEKVSSEKTHTPLIKLSNTMDILSDEEDDAPSVKSPIENVQDKATESPEKQCINLIDDDDVMLIDDDTNKKEIPQAEPPAEKVEESHSKDAIETSIGDPKGSETIATETTDEIEKDSAKPETEIKENLPSQPETDKPLEAIPEKLPEKPKPLIPHDFFKTYRKNLADMTRDDLEEFCILKIVESIIDRSNLNDIRSKLKSMGQSIEEYKKKAMMLTKQNRDLQVVLKSVQEEQKKTTGNQPITPLKITRSVGMQVLMTDKSRRRVMPGPAGTGNTLNNTNQINSRNARNPSQSPRNTPQKPVSSQAIPVPRLVPANPNIVNKPVQVTATAITKATVVQNGVKNTSPAQKPEKRTHNRIQSQSSSSSVTVDLTDDEPPSKIATKNSPTPPVRLVNPQNLLAPRQQFSQVNSPRKVYIPISINGPQAQAMRPGQTIMLKTVAAQGPRPRGPPPTTVVRAPNMLRRVGSRHPAPLPDAMKQYQPPNWKALPPAPDLKLSKVENGIVISWKIEGYQEDSYEEIASYQLYAYQETSAPASTSLWKKIGDVKALPLPMACTLTQFMAGYKYYFAVRAVDIRSRLGPFSLPGSILLLNKM